MAQTGNPKNREEEIEKNKKRIASLEEELKKSRTMANCNEKILQDKIESLEKEIRDLKSKNEELGNQLHELKEKMEKLESENEVQKASKDEEDNVLILGQLRLALQKNLCNYVLGNDFISCRYYKFKEIKNYIKKDVKAADRRSARERLRELNDKISWDQNLVDSLKNLNQKRIGIAHPELSSKKIEHATEFLRKKGELDEEMVEIMNTLKEQWEASEALLNFRTATAVADKGNTSSYTGRLKENIKKNEKKINDLEEEKEKLLEKVRDHEENCQPKINELKEEIARLREENKTLKTEVGYLKESNAFLENEMESVKQTNGELKKELGSTIKQLKERDEKLKTFELSEDELIITQLCSSVQQNILKIVLQEYFDEIENKSIIYMEKVISTQIEDEDKQDEARGRWEKLKEEVKWDDYLIIQLKPVTKNGNETAHPPLTDDGIEKAKANLIRKKVLGKNNIKAVDKLKTIWQQTNSKLLQNGPITRSAEDHRARKRAGEDWYRMSAEHLPRKRLAEDRPETRSTTEGRDRAGGPTRSLSRSATGRSQDASTRTAAGGRYDIPPNA